MNTENNLQQTMKNVQEGWQKMFDNFKGFSDNVQAITLVDKISGELLLDGTISGIAIKEAIKENKPCVEVIKTCADMLADGWQGLSLNLSEEIRQFVKQ